MIIFFLAPLLFFGFFLILIIFFLKKSSFLNKIKNFFHLYRGIFIYFFSFFLFVSVLWFVIYKNSSVNIADKNIICFLTSYLLEIILSLDNVFIWFLVFKSFKVPVSCQKKILFYGLLVGLILRVIFSFLGVFLLSKYHWILYFFGIFFVWISLKILFTSNKKENKKNVSFLWIYKIFPIIYEAECKNFFLKINNKTFFTPLFVSLIFIEFSDIVFSIDSIPAIFSITQNLFIVLSSNLFAVLALRSMYLFIAPMINQFPMIEYALSFILMLIGLKIIFEKFITISTFLTFIVILIILITAFIINVTFIKNK
ncbi:TerC family protein [Buchnera aphidicola]|uniref:Uncharacterized protein n=1 Tax=Buchnera aphidicola (Aphis gossypii) TaxID=98785 RepID=A0A5J6Z9D7_9GAMM|nr:hypothetical protein [Buchnera aphidicola]QFQ32012.1 hypothetical protein FQV32_01060 [Buchnera aphidicola (Aphis gossypii)]UPT14541.1 hypothetical protein HWH54_01055 [Buchnera aphidicola (Aphis gossypii)]